MAASGHFVQLSADAPGTALAAVNGANAAGPACAAAVASSAGRASRGVAEVHGRARSAQVVA